MWVIVDQWAVFAVGSRNDRLRVSTDSARIRNRLFISVRISITERTAWRWESDNPPWPQPERQAALEQLFGRPVTELGFTPPWAGDAPQGRQAGQAGASPAVTVSMAAGPHAVFPRRALAEPLPGSIAADYLSVTSAYRRMDLTGSPRTARSIRESTAGTG
jgi:hypothetical protein